MAPTRSSASSTPPASPPARSTATRARRSASARIAAFKSGEMQGADRDRHRRARDRHSGRQPRRQLRPARRARAICPPHRPHRARRRDGIAIAFCAPDERGNLRDIERTTRQKIAVAPLPADFMASAEAFKRLKPAPKAAPQRHERSSTKADRRSDGQRRQNRNGPARSASRRGQAVIAAASDRTGQQHDPRSEPCGASASSSAATASHRTARSHRETRPIVGREGQRQPQPNQARGGYRPNGGQPKRKFRGRRAGPAAARATPRVKHRGACMCRRALADAVTGIAICA